MNTAADRQRSTGADRWCDRVENDSFRPAWWCPGPHAQTIWAVVGRPTPVVRLHRERWETPDGDFLDLDRVNAASNGPILIVLHGLESSSRSKKVLGLLGAAAQAGWEGMAMNFRSCSGEPNRLRRAYHGGDTTDLAWVIHRLLSEDPRRQIVCAGVSLGGNVLLKYLGEQAECVPLRLRAAVAISTPFDLGVSVTHIESGMSRILYMQGLVRKLKRKTLAKLKRYPDLVDPTLLRAVRTLADFDHLVTGPIHGFADAHAYWRSSSSRSFLGTIRRPTLLINAADDPFYPAGALPTQAVVENPALMAAFVKCGGHSGFISGRWPGRPVFWAEQRTMAFLQEHLKGTDPSCERGPHTLRRTNEGARGIASRSTSSGACER